MRTRTEAAWFLLCAGVVLVAPAGLLGCTHPGEPDLSSTSSTSMDQPATAAPANFVPGGTAEQNLLPFEQILQRIAGSDPATPGGAVVDALVAVGFTRDAMQLTADKTSAGLEADSVQVSVKLADACLIGQYGPKSGGVHAMVAAPISTGACLVGRTKPVSG